MIHLIYGPDIYRVRKSAGELIADLRSKHPDAAFNVLDFNDDEAVEELAGIFNGASLFSPARIVHLKNVAQAAKETASYFSSKKFTDDKDTFVVMEDSTVTGADDKNILKLAELQGIKSRFIGLLAGKNLTNWVKKECDALGISIGAAAVDRCVERTGNDTATLIQEIAKLHNYSAAVSREITGDDVDALVPEHLELNIFKFVDALAGKNKGLAYDLLFRHNSGESDAHDILQPILYQFRNLLIAKDMLNEGATPQKIAKAAEIHPFAAQKAAGLSRFFSLDDLKRLYGHLLSLEVGSKKGILNLDDELYRFVLR